MVWSYKTRIISVLAIGIRGCGLNYFIEFQLENADNSIYHSRFCRLCTFNGPNLKNYTKIDTQPHLLIYSLRSQFVAVTSRFLFEYLQKWQKLSGMALWSELHEIHLFWPTLFFRNFRCTVVPEFNPKGTFNIQGWHPPPPT